MTDGISRIEIFLLQRRIRDDLLGQVQCRGMERRFTIVSNFWAGFQRLQHVPSHPSVECLLSLPLQLDKHGGMKRLSELPDAAAMSGEYPEEQPSGQHIVGRVYRGNSIGQKSDDVRPCA